jgi:hypothetical protein
MDPQNAQAVATTLQPLGWIFLISSQIFVWGLTFWCFKKVMSLPPEDDSIVTPPDMLGG